MLHGRTRLLIREGEMPKTPDKISIKMKFCTVTLEHVRNEQKKVPSIGPWEHPKFIMADMRPKSTQARKIIHEL